MNATNSIRLALVTTLFLTACISAPATPPASTQPPSSQPPAAQPSVPFRGLGGYELSFDGIQSALSSRVAARDPQVTTQGLNAATGLSFAPLSQSTFVKDGVRYLSASFKVTPTASVTNLTLMAQVNSPKTLADTAVLRLTNFNGTPLTGAALTTAAQAIKPLHGMTLSGAGLSEITPMSRGSSFQAFAESDLDGYAPSDGGYLLPWGFVASTASGSRTITPSDPGFVTFGFRLPSSGADGRNDPFGFSVFLDAVMDSATRITETLEEQSQAALALVNRATTAGAAEVNVFATSTYEPSFQTDPSARVICAVRTAGTALAPAAQLFTLPPRAIPTLSDPLQNARSVPRSNPSVTLNFADLLRVGEPVLHSSFQRYTDAAVNRGSALGVTPARDFKSGEELEVSVPARGRLRQCGVGGWVSRFRAASEPGQVFEFKRRGGSGPGAGSTDVTIGDLNGDGLLDIALTDQAGANDTLEVFLGTSNGISSSSLSLTIRNAPTSLALGDLNGDGVLDVAIAHADDIVSVRLGLGNGRFSSAVEIGVGDNPQELALGDLNGDGVLDMAVVNFGVASNSSTTSVLLGAGDGTFVSAGAVSVGKNPNDIALGDLNGDGVLDLAVSNKESYSVSIRLGAGDGTFSNTSEDSNVGSRPTSVALGDLNGDGVLDMVVAESSVVYVKLGTGLGTFVSAGYVVVGSDPRGVALGDLNGDGVLDMAVTNFGSETVSLRLGVGDGRFIAVSGNSSDGEVPVDEQAVKIALGDLNGDNVLDMALVHAGGALSIRASTQTVAFNPSAVALAPSSSRQLSLVTNLTYLYTGLPSSNPSAATMDGTGTVTALPSLGSFADFAPSGGSSVARVVSTTNFLLGALDLTGTGSYTTVPDNASLNLEGNFTLEAWVRIPDVSALPSGDVVLLEKRSRSGGAYPYSLTLDSSRKVRFDLQTTSSTTQTVSTLTASNQTPLSDGNWHHLAVTSTLSGTTSISRILQLYVDGVQVDSDSQSFAVTTTANTAPLSLGAAQDGTLKAPMQIDEVRLWNVSKSATDLSRATYRTNPLAPPYSSDLMAYFKMDQINNSGTTRNPIRNVSNEVNSGLNGRLSSTMTGLELVPR